MCVCVCARAFVLDALNFEKNVYALGACAG